MNLAFRQTRLAVLGLALLSCLVGVATATPRADPRYAGRGVYRATRGPVPGVVVEILVADGDGRPTDEVLGSTHADAQGRFVVLETNVTDEPVALVVSAVRESADSGGDRRGEGYEIRTHRTVLGFLPHPSPTKPNTILIERRRPGRGGDESDE